MPTDLPLADTGIHQCDNCQKVWTADQLKDFCDIMQRIEPGGMVPSGECPECKTFCYPVEPGEEPMSPEDEEKHREARRDCIDEIYQNCDDPSALLLSIMEDILTDGQLKELHDRIEAESEEDERWDEEEKPCT